MGDIAYSRTFDCRPADLWPWLTESDKLKQWLHGMETHRYETPGPLAEGTRYKMEIKEGRGLTPYEGEILAIETNRLLLQRTTGGCGPKKMTIENDYRLTDLGRSTQLDYACRMQFPPGLLWKLMGALGSLLGRSMVKRFFKTLASKVERTA